jgi:hypothetical protein
MKRKKSLSIGTLSLAMLLLASCAQDVVINDSPNKESDKFIAFNPLAEKSDTRAQLIDDDNLENFAVWAAADLTNVNSADDYTLQNVLVYRDGMSWTYKPQVLWPANTLDFYAIAPGLSRNIVNGVLFPGGGTNEYFDYLVPRETEDGKMLQEDLLIARRSDVASTGTAVTLQFQHALSRVVFRARSAVEGANLIIRSVTMNGLYGRGRLDFSTADIPENQSFRAAGKYSDDDHDPAFIQWTNHASKESYEVAITQKHLSSDFTPVMVDNTMRQIHTNANALMVMPQQTVLAVIDNNTGNVSNPGSSEAEYPFNIAVYWAPSTDPDDLRYTYFPVSYPDSKTTTGSSGDGTDLFDPKPIAFEMGRQYTFDITMTHKSGVNFITMQPQVSDWDDFSTITDGEPPVDTPIPVPHYSVGDVYDRDPTDDSTDDPETDAVILVYDTDKNGKPTKLAYFRNTAISITLTGKEVADALGEGGDLGDTFVSKFTANLGLTSSDTIDITIEPTDPFWKSVEMKNIVTNNSIYNDATDILVLNSVTDGGRIWPDAYTFGSAIADGSALITGLDFWLLNGETAALTTYENSGFRFSIAGSSEGTATLDLYAIAAESGSPGLTLTGYVDWDSLTLGNTTFTMKNSEPANKLIMYVVGIVE